MNYILGFFAALTVWAETVENNLMPGDAAAGILPGLFIQAGPVGQRQIKQAPAAGAF